MNTVFNAGSIFFKDKKNNHLETKKILLKISSENIEQSLTSLESSRQGLDGKSVEQRLIKYGRNDIVREKQDSWYLMFLTNFTNPFILVLIVLGVVSWLTADIIGTVIVAIMVTISVFMRFIQEYRSSRAAKTLRAMVRTIVNVKRSYYGGDLPLEELVPGDIVLLSAGDMIPADVRLIFSKDLFISQAALSGESIPIVKHDQDHGVVDVKESQNPLDRTNLCFMGTSVVSGFAEALVVATGKNTFLGSLSADIIGHHVQTRFDKGISSVTWIAIRFILIIVPIIFFVNWFCKHELQSAFLFALSVAVVLTPEMLPMIVTANLSKGAVSMSSFKVIVKRLSSIQNIGAMDILCTDKTGTLTQDKIILEKYLDLDGNDNIHVLEYGFLNSYFQSGLKNILDQAILNHAKIEKQLNLNEEYKKVDEIPFDFVRKRVSVVLSKDETQHLLICKGAVEELLTSCSKIKHEDKILPLDPEYSNMITDLAFKLSSDGFRVIAVAYKKLALRSKAYSVVDEKNLIFIGLMAFLDPPKETAAEAISILNKHNVSIKVLTGDNGAITKRICQEVNLPYDTVLLGSELEEMTDQELSKKVEVVNIFAKLSPLQKSRIIRILQTNGHVVGFLGDGINDAPALKDSDVGFSVDTATDIARESADIILLEKSLLVLGDGVITGRVIYGNIIKYIKLTTSSSVGAALSFLIASIFLPFFPMLPLQLLIQNLLYDFSQLAIPWDKMDEDFIQEPKKWDPKSIIRFMFVIGPLGAMVDLMCFGFMWYVLQANSIENQSLFQSAFFVESLMVQVLIVHMIRTKKISFIRSMATMPMMLMAVFIMALGIIIPFSPLGAAVNLQALPPSFFIFLFGVLLLYSISAQLLKLWYSRRFNSWL